jgi:cytochrome c oxidase subunit II
MDRFRLLPESASTAAERTDPLFWFLCGVSAFFTALIFFMVVYLAIKYRRRSAVPPPSLQPHYLLEIVWTIVPFIVVMAIFFWGARVYFFLHRPPPDALEIHVIGKQWMWKLQQPNGKREINELHLPLGRAVRLTLASQDVIHSFFVPAFRIKQDAVPGRYTSIWFQPNRLGEFRLFCAEYCGTNHSAMIGKVVVMEPERYQAWLTGSPIEETPAQSGERLYVRLGCNVCHGVKAPTLAGLYGGRVLLADGSNVTADENYLRESILDSTARVVAGYAPLMPSFRGQLSEEQLMELLSYIKSLKEPAALRKAE